MMRRGRDAWRSERPAVNGGVSMTTAATPVTPGPAPVPAYPLRFSVEFPDRVLDRFSSFFRIFFVIPIAIVLGVIGGSSWGGDFVYVAGVLFLGPLLMIVFRQKYPRWWWDFNVQLLRFEARVCSYLLLLRDEYPSTDEEQAVHLEAGYPDVRRDLNRWLPLVKWFLSLPHYIVLVFLIIGVVVAAIIAWFAILFTGRYPRGLFNYVVGVMRWGYRVTAYAFLLNTDKYPPFELA